ncbi:MAG: AI-2E family transporter, partial [Deltaproteobacteria bacterium]
MSSPSGPSQAAPRPQRNGRTRARRAKFRVSTPFVVVLLGGAALTGYLVRPFWSPLFLAATLAVACYPLHQGLARRMRDRPRLSGFILTLSMLTFIIAPLASMITVAVREVTQGLQWMQDSLGIGSLQELSFGHLPPQVQTVLRDALAWLHIGPEDLHGYTGKALGYVQQAAPGVLSMSFNAISATLFVLAAFYFLLVDGKSTVDFLVRISPLQKPQTDELFDEFRRTSSAALL